MSNEQHKDSHRYLLQVMLVLFILQPVMDVLSYWQDTLGMSNGISLLLRFVMLAGTAGLGFYLSRRKKAYVLLGVVLGGILLLHSWSCMTAGYAGYNQWTYDWINFIRVAQIPLFTFCFITFLRETGEAGCRTIEQGFVINFVIIVAVEVLSAMTGTNPCTYANKGIGLLGWFYFANSQSAILSVIVPVVLMQLIRKNNPWLLIFGTAAGFGVLYLFATRLTYFSIFICAAGLVIVLILSRNWNRRTAAILLIGAVLCGIGYGISPMTRNQQAQKQVAVQKQQEADELIAQMEQEYGTTVAESPEICLEPMYEEYLGAMMDRFGAERVMETYDYTTDVSDLKDWRRMKLTYCSFLMEEAGTASKAFGLELADMTWRGEVFDVENDFHGIYFLYGIVGLLALILFLLYFVWLVLRVLWKNFRMYMTLEAGAFGVAFCTLLLHIYCTAGVLRRPNASFYLSVVLAVIYYFVKLKQYSKQDG